MTKLVALRVQVPVDDAITTEQVRDLLRTRLRGTGTEIVKRPERGGQIDIEGVMAGEIHWTAADVRMGSLTRAAQQRNPNGSNARKETEA